MCVCIRNCFNGCHSSSHGLAEHWPVEKRGNWGLRTSCIFYMHLDKLALNCLGYYTLSFPCSIPREGQRRHTSKKWVPVQGGAGLRNKLLVIPTKCCFLSGYKVCRARSWCSSNMRWLLQQQKNLHAPTGFSTINGTGSLKKKKEFGPTPLLPFSSTHACWLHQSLVLILWCSEAWVRSHLPSSLGSSDYIRVLCPWFQFVLPVLIFSF